uniref:RNA-directed DNA polymerase n=1 Tax=Trichuris muris TaxID=70415 RepID=A0A5S6QND2_TRIMR
MPTVAPEISELLQQQSESLQATLEMLTRLLAPRTAENRQPSMDNLANNISEFCYDPDNGSTFDAWFTRYEDIFTIECGQMEDAAKVRLVLRKLNISAHQKYINFILPKKPNDIGFAETVKRLKDMFGRQRSLFSTRYQCLKLAKRDCDDFITYAGMVNRECDQFQLNALTEDQFKCLVFVSGLQSATDSEIRLRLLSKMETDADVTIQALIEECRRITSLNQDAILVAGASPKESEPFINAVAREAKLITRRPSMTKRMKKGHGNIDGRRPVSDDGTAAKEPPSPKPKTPCWLCGAMHFVRNCPFKLHKCRRCGGTGHKEGYCEKQSKGTRREGYCGRSNRSTRTTHRVNSVTGDSIAVHRRFVSVTVLDHQIRFRIDTGSDLTLLTRKTWKRLGIPRLSAVDTQAKDVSGNQIEILGQLRCSFTFGDRMVTAKCYVPQHVSCDLLGVELIEKLGIYDTPINATYGITRSQGTTKTNGLSTKTKVSSLFTERRLPSYPALVNTGLGLCSKVKASLHLKPEAKPIFRPKRPVPYAAIAQVDTELDRLENLGIISKVSHSNWAAPIVVVKKANGSFRICADFSTGLNSMLELHQYPLPTPEDLFTVLNGGRLFSKLDFADAYLQVEVEDDSKELLTINTHRGLYRYNRLPFGVKSAPGIFQQIMDTMIADLSGTVAYLDDLLVVGQTVEEHDRNLEAVLGRISEFGFKIRPEKCQFGLQEVKYLGFIVDRHGRRPDPEKIAAIQRMPHPHDMPSLRSFLGLLSYYGVFVREMRNLRAPLDNLLKKETTFVWSTTCQAAFDKAKLILQSNLLLTHFDPTVDVVVAADASNNGLGAVIFHRFPDGKEKPIAHASRSLLPAEKNYSQIEKEALALVFAVEKFHRFVLGRRFTLLTDHQPLLAIFGTKKGIPLYTANRLQRWATTLLGYDFALEYRSTTSFGNADALSRLIATQLRQEEDIVIASVDGEIQRVLVDAVRNLPVTSRMIRDETARDPMLQKVLQCLSKGWPKVRAPLLQHFYNRRQSLSVVDGCLLFADRVVVPNCLQGQVTSQLHSEHPGIVRMKALARSVVYWPGLDQQIENIVRQCSACAMVAKLPAKTPPCSWPPADKCWSRVHVDYAGPVEGRYLLVLVDAFSKWPEVFITEKITSSATISLLSRVFAQFGAPETIVSDNGTQFTAAEFKIFCAKNGIQHILIPPGHPQSNGQAERFVDTLKRGLAKMKGEGPITRLVQRFLFHYRSSPNASFGYSKSPAEAFLGRPLRTAISLIHPAKETQRSNASARLAPPGAVRSRAFKPGESVYVLSNQETPKWLEGQVIARRGKVVYDVSVAERICSRHINQLRSRPSIVFNGWIRPSAMDNGQGEASLPQGKESRAENRKAQPSPPGPYGFDASQRPRRNRRTPRRFSPDPEQKF